MLGFALAGSQVQAPYPQAAVGAARTPQGAVTDSALVALGTVLVVIPGLVTTAAGLLLLLPPTRAVARPLADGAGRPQAAADHRRRPPPQAAGRTPAAATTSTARSSTSVDVVIDVDRAPTRHCLAQRPTRL